MELPVLQAQCDQCFGLCCVLVPFFKADGFGDDKPSGVPCRHLDQDDRCSIHERLLSSGWSGCSRFDCFGAGQHVSQVTYAGRSWREHGNLGEMAAVLSVMRQLHEMLALLDEADRRGTGSAAPLLAHVVALVHSTPAQLLAVDLDDIRTWVRPCLDHTRQAAAERWPEAVDHFRHDLAGRDLRGRDLRGANLTGSLLIGADLREADLTDACLLGADVRDADARGALVEDALFLTGPQRAAMRT